MNGNQAISSRSADALLAWARRATILSAASGAAVTGAAALALEWSAWAVAIAVVSGAVSAFLGRSVSIIAVGLVAGLGGLSAVLAGLVVMGVEPTAGLLWPLIGAILLAFPILAGVVARAIGWATPALAVDLTATLVSCLIAVGIARHLDLSSNLLIHLVTYEDNQAWVALVTQLENGMNAGAVQGALGPTIVTLLGALLGLKGSSVDVYNTVIGAYLLAMIVMPLAVAACLRHAARRAWPVAVVTCLVAVGWAMTIPTVLYQQYGHLTAVWAGVACIVLVGVLVRADRSPGWALLATLVAFAMGSVWFPLLPLAVVAIAYTMVSSVRRRPIALRGALVVVLGAVLVVLACLQGYAVLAIGEVAPGVRQGLEVLYRAEGGTAALDGALQVALLAAFAVAVATFSRGDDLSRRFLVLATGAIAYAAAVYAGAFLAKVDGGYGATKVWYLLGSVLIALSVAYIATLDLEPRRLAGVMLALGFGALVYGGSGTVLSRTWLSPPAAVPWLAPLVAVVGDESRGANRPIVCFDNEKIATYSCSRWAAGLSTAGDGPFLDYRMQVVNEGDTAAAVDRLVASGVLSRSDLILINPPDDARPWGWTLLEGAGRVYGPDGAELSQRPARP